MIHLTGVRSMASQLELQKRWYGENIPLRDQIVADVGANVGVLSRFFWDAGEGTNRVVSFEPLRENVAQIQTQIDETGATGWSVETCAITDHDGEVTLRVGHDDEEGWNSVISGASSGESRTVPARRLSTALPDATIVKVDIEGHEYTVLEEAVPRLQSVHTWAIEFHLVPGRPLEAALGLLHRHGFGLSAAGRRPDDPGGAWMSAPIPHTLGWAPIPVAKRRADGSVFKMLHVLARRDLP